MEVHGRARVRLHVVCVKKRDPCRQGETTAVFGSFFAVCFIPAALHFEQIDVDEASKRV